MAFPSRLVGRAGMRQKLGGGARGVAGDGRYDQLEQERKEALEQEVEQAVQNEHAILRKVSRRRAHAAGLASRSTGSSPNPQPESGAKNYPPKRVKINAAITYSRLSTTIGRVDFTTVFGMVTGVSPHVWSPRIACYTHSTGCQGVLFDKRASNESRYRLLWDLKPNCHSSPPSPSPEAVAISLSSMGAGVPASSTSRGRWYSGVTSLTMPRLSRSSCLRWMMP